MFRRLFNLPAAYRKVLLAGSVLMVLAFQGYWLRTAFVQSHEALIQEVQFRTSETLLALQLQKVNAVLGQGTTLSNTARNLDSLMRLGKNAPGGTAASTIIVQDYRGHSDADKKALLQNLNTLSSDSGLEHTLYQNLRTSLDKEYPGIQLTVLKKLSGKTLFYPLEDAGIEIEMEENDRSNLSAPVYSSPTTSFQVYVMNADRMAVARIWSNIAFSVLYVFLIFLTVFAIESALAYHQRLLRAKQRFSRNMTHELKLPLSTISLATEGLRKYGNTGDDAAPYLNAIQQGATRLDKLIEQILNNALSEENLPPPQKEKLLLHALVEGVTQEMALQIQTAGATLDYASLPLDSAVFADAIQLSHALTNVIDNTLKYAQRPPVIRLSLQMDSRYATLLISDNGPGIAAAHHEDIFQPYFRIGQDTVHDVKGFGLGLSYVQQVMKAHGGAAYVVKSSSEGTTIGLKFPLHHG